MHKQIVVVTGASGGIGRVIAETLIRADYAVVFVYHENKPVLPEWMQELQDAQYLLIQADLRSDSETEKMIEEIHRKLGSVSVLINCAGIALPQMVYEDATDAMMKLVFDLNVFAPMRTTRMLLKDLRENEGTVINISSMWGVSGASCEVIYSASKAALNGFTKALAKELAPSQVTVNAIAPGFIPTSMNAGISVEDTELFRLDTPLERLGTPQDIADAVLYLIRARFMTGQILSVDGGINI